MKVLVVGGSGFIGRHIVRALDAIGADVTNFSRSAPKFDHDIKYIQGSFLDENRLSQALSGKDLVIHSLSTTVPSTSAVDPIYDVETNLVGTINLLNLMTEQKVRRLIYLSSGGTVYGNTSERKISEMHRLNPISTYGVVKVAIEKMIHVKQAQGKLSSTIIRPSNPYGVGQVTNRAQGLISTIISNYMQGKTTSIFGNGQAVRDYIYVSDIATFISKLAVSEKNGVYNVGSGKGYSINEVLSTISSVVGERVSVKYEPSRGFDVDRIVLDSEKAKSDFGWQCTLSLEEGIRKQYLWMRGLDKS